VRRRNREAGSASKLHPAFATAPCEFETNGVFVLPGAALPQRGMRIRGVFAEADEQNRARRLLVGGEPVGGNLILYVGVNNLKNPEQRLYSRILPPTIRATDR